MLKSLKKFLKVYPLPIFVLLLSFVIYYSAFELLRTRGTHSIPQTEADSMQSESNPIVADNTKPIESQESKEIAQVQETEVVPPVQPLDEPQNPAKEASKIYLSTHTKSLNIRQEPSTSAAIVGKLTPADQMALIEEKGDWVLIAEKNSDKPLGWIMKRFSYEIMPQEPTQEFPIQEIPSNAQELLAPAPIPTNKVYLTSNVRSLNIRQEPDATAPIIGKLTPSHKAMLLEERGEWILIGTYEQGKVLGWILKSYTQELPQEVMISETRNLASNPVSVESQMSAPQTTLPTTLPVSTESQNQVQPSQEIPNSTTIQSTQDSPIYTSRVPSLNIRELPSTDTPVVGRLTPNDSVIIVETQDVWVRILDANTPSVKNGWVVRRSLTPRQ